MNELLNHALRDFKRHILAGLIAAGPLFITWLVLTFVLGVLANASLPLIRLVAAGFPDTAMSVAWVQYTLAVLLTIALFYLIGRLTSRVMGRQLFDLFEASLERLPLVNKVYTSVRQLTETLISKNKTGQRVVLIDFPMAGQKSIALLTHVITDEVTGRKIAAVLVPQAINPSSSYLQFLPMEAVTETDMTIEQAMSALLTGGAVCPETIRYTNPLVAKGPGAAVLVTTEVTSTTTSLDPSI